MIVLKQKYRESPPPFIFYFFGLSIEMSLSIRIDKENMVFYSFV